MVFSSIPAYLDPPNWHQQQNQHQANGSEISQLLPPLPGLQPHAQPAQPTVVNQTQAQAQLAKIPPSETALKCPRCESTNTKFCYFNNYSLSQPRHFCKTCRRYWTRGGALRNVPVGGGCRRNNNKKSKRSTRSKSPVSNDKESFSNSASAIFNPHEQIGQFPQPITNRPYMTSLQNLSRYGIGVGNIGHMGVQNGIHSSTAGGVLPLDQWRFQQFPFLNNFESTSSAVSYPFQSEIVEASPTSRVSHQLPSVKVEYNNGGLNLLRSPLSISENNPYNSWTDFSALASSSASHLL